MIQCIVLPYRRVYTAASLLIYFHVFGTDWSGVLKSVQNIINIHILCLKDLHEHSHWSSWSASRGWSCSTSKPVSHSPIPVCLVSALHTALTHLEHQGSYVRMLFVDISSAFNMVIPSRLVTKLTDLGFCQPTCYWIKDFLTNHHQTVRLGPHLSSTLTLNTGSPQGCVLSPILYALYTHDCASPIPPTPSSSSWTTQLWLDLSQEDPIQPTEMKSKDWQHGVQRTISSWTPQKPKNS